MSKKGCALQTPSKLRQAPHEPISRCRHNRTGVRAVMDTRNATRRIPDGA
jgi:hypothetical protein